MCDQVPFLGHYVLCDGIEVDPMKTAHAVKEVRAFLVLASYYICDIPNFAFVATPLTGLTKKDAKLI